MKSIFSILFIFFLTLNLIGSPEDFSWLESVDFLVLSGENDESVVDSVYNSNGYSYERIP